MYPNKHNILDRKLGGGGVRLQKTSFSSMARASDASLRSHIILLEDALQSLLADDLCSAKERNVGLPWEHKLGPGYTESIFTTHIKITNRSQTPLHNRHKRNKAVHSRSPVQPTQLPDSFTSSDACNAPRTETGHTFDSRATPSVFVYDINKSIPLFQYRQRSSHFFILTIHL